MRNALRISTLLALACLGSLVTGMAQAVTEDFDSGFSPALGWAGDTDRFVAETGTIRLADPDPGSSNRARVWLGAATQDTACWELTLDLDFSASTSNRLVWWLAANGPLDQALVSGYAVEVGGISGMEDAVVLAYTASDGQKTTIVESSPGSANGELDGSLRVCRSRTAEWTLDVQLNTAQEVVQANFSEPLAGAVAGFDLRYSSTRADKFAFDRLSIDPIVVDVSPPMLLEARVVDSREIELAFDEALAGIAINPNNVSVEGNTVSQASIAGQRLNLTLTDPLPDRQDVAISGGPVLDAAGNSALFSTSVRYVAPRQLARYDLLISELMADPAPAVGLPEVEYVEVHNASAAALSLSDAQLEVNGTRIALPNLELLPGAFLALANEDVGGDARYIVVSELPALTNSGGTVRLYNNVNDVIDEVEYSVAWHEPSKDDGGFSLERIDLSKPCIVGAPNWASSSALAGGSPSVANSAAAVVVVDSLAIARLSVTAADQITVDVNRVLENPLDGAFAATGIGIVQVAEGDRLGTYVLDFDRAFEVGEVYALRLDVQARSCTPSVGVSRALNVFGAAEASSVGDWVINEIMFDPLSGQGRWVELANTSAKLLNTSDLTVARSDAAGLVDELFEPRLETLVPPGGLVVFANDRERLLGEFPEALPGAVVETDVPTLGDEDCLLVFDARAQEVFEQVCYSSDWHNRAYASTDGVSLERVALSGMPNEPTNWTSAASTANFGTPTRTNSQAVAAGSVLPEGEFALVSERLSPDNDGFEDLLRLDYNFSDPETLAKFEVYDLASRPVLTQDEDISPGRVGTWTWDGVDDDGQVVAVGTYVLRLSFFSPSSSRTTEFFAFSVLSQR